MVVYECRLIFHKKPKPNDDDVLFNSKDFPQIKSGCLLEIFHSESEKHHLIKIESVNSNFQQKDTISFDQVLASGLRLTANKILKFKIIDENLITLDVLDIIVKDQYLSRSDMYRFINSIKNSVLQMSKKLEFGPYRGTVGEMWCKGQRNHSGYFGANTRVVFRSATSVVHIFIQMSSEMWEFDYFGELYFDKAINFISDLFNKWNDNNCGHDVTIVLFSRLFYKNIDQEKIAENTRRNIKMDHNNRYYEDFYIVVVQNERYVIGEWRKVIKTLKFRFNNYKSELEEFQQKHFHSDISCESYLSTAENANFLETLNITLNLYENYYIDRNFERTGKICVVITAGSGVYNVDRVQTHLTKQRICDLGVGMDLVCIGEQPLHAVPLFIFHQKSAPAITDNYYYIPYWINHSFYRSVNELQAIQMGKFIPRIKVKIDKVANVDETYQNKNSTKSNCELSEDNLNVFRKMSRAEIVSGTIQPSVSTSNNFDRGGLIVGSYSSTNGKEDSHHHSLKIGNKKLSESAKTQFNPFAPHRFNIHTTSNSRRWSHVFPIDSHNKPIQLHHQLAINSPHLYGFEKRKSKNMVEAWQNYFKLYNDANCKVNESLDLSSSPITKDMISSPKLSYHEIDESEVMLEKPSSVNLNDKASDDSVGLSPLPSSFQGGGSQKSGPQGSSLKSSVNRKAHSLFTDGEQRWCWDQAKEDESPINHMGVDWKSLTLPAMLPITSDYFPSLRILEDEFLESNYQLMTDNSDNNGDTGSQSHRKSLGIQEVFQELIYQRLNQGFQLITNPPSINNQLHKDTNKKHISKTTSKNIVYRFGLGFIYHSIQMKQDLIYVTQYSPRHVNNLDDITYKYCLKMPDSREFMMSKTRFSTQMLEKFNWNYHDHYILNYGGSNGDNTGENECRYKLIPSLKFWRSRFYLLPIHTATKTIIDTDKNTKIKCDIYDDKSVVEQNCLVEEFFKFLEVINKIKRRTMNSKKMSNRLIDNSTNLLSSSSMTKLKSVSSHLDLKFTFDSIESVGKSSSGYDIDKLTDTSPIPKILEEMTNTQSGLTFLPSNEFPNEYTFTSYEAVNWCIRKIEKINDVKTAVAYLQKLMNLKYIFHASECPSHKFIYGFVFYCFNTSTKFLNNGWLDARTISNNNSGSSSMTNLTTEEMESSSKSRRRFFEWVEIYLSSIEIDGKCERESNKPIDSSQNITFLMKNIPQRLLTNCLTLDNIREFIGDSYDFGMLFEKNGVLYKKVVLDIDSERSDRPEWGVFQYQANYHPTMAFELMFQWLVATGGKLAEKISQWSRKTSILQLVPVPCDPFALPSSINSDPLRGPIFVPLNIDCLINSPDYDSTSKYLISDIIDFLFDEFPDTERLYRLLLFQEVILKRFGFIRESCVNYSTREQRNEIERVKFNHEDKSGSENVISAAQNIGGTSFNWSFIHYSGGMFAMVPSYSFDTNIDSQISLPIKLDDTYIHFSSPNIRHVNTDEDSDEWESPSIGFLWSWNKMMTRKWTTSGMVVDEQFQDRMLADFREFCSNTDDRLRQFYFDAKAMSTKYFSDVSSHD